MTGPAVLEEPIALEEGLPPKMEATLPAKARLLKEILADAERTALARAMKRYPTSRKLGFLLGLSHTTVLKKTHKNAFHPSKK
jgi:transcriptional regulator of aroF, aroG, tyrA and aromatic amino acid transport